MCLKGFYREDLSEMSDLCIGESTDRWTKDGTVLLCDWFSILFQLFRVGPGFTIRCRWHFREGSRFRRKNPGIREGSRIPERL